MLAVEILGGIAVIPYALCLVLRVTNGAPPPPDEKGLCATKLPYHIRVIVPCYKEPLDVIAKTVQAALYAVIPAGCKRTGVLMGCGSLAPWASCLGTYAVTKVLSAAATGT